MYKHSKTLSAAPSAARRPSEECYLGLVNNHCVINDLTNLTSYCLEDYEEVKDISDCNLI